MATMVMAVLLTMAMLARWRDLPAIRPVRRLLVDKPAAWFNTLTRQHLIFGALMLLILMTCGEMLAAMGPLDMSLILLWDVSAFVDVAIALTTLSAAARIKGSWRLLAAWRPTRTGRRAARAPRRPADRHPDNDDESEGRSWRRAA